MNEIQRILDKGIVSEDFLKPETICDFYVDENRKQLWAVCLDLLDELDKCCKRHNLKYFLSGGSLLGVIRHKGFIPWDDDIDVEMPREDYDKLLLYKDEFLTPYFFQTPLTDPGYYFSCNKLRNVNTSSVSVMFQYDTFCQGIGIDIFPLDRYKKSGMRSKHERIKDLALDLGTYLRITNPELDEKNRQRVASYSGRDPMDTYNMMNDIFLEDSGLDVDQIGLLSCPSYDISKVSHDLDDFDELILGDFCGMKVPIPKRYDKVLRTQFGNYMQLPPVETRGTWHSGVIFDANKPYTEYLKKCK